jgi:hypothetical protein
MRSIACFFLFILWIVFTVLLTISIIGLILVLDEADGWFEIGNTLADKI